jgi:HEAT repeat protein
VLVAAHRDRDAGVRAAVADALGAVPITGASEPSIDSALLALVTDSATSTRLRAVQALRAIRGPARRDALRMALRDSSAAVRTAAIHGITQDTATLSALEEEITRVLTDTSVRVRLAAVQALGVLPQATNSLVMAALSARLTDGDATVRTEAAHALTQFHARGGRDPSPPEPSSFERCKQLPPRTRGC